MKYFIIFIIVFTMLIIFAVISGEKKVQHVKTNCIKTNLIVETSKHGFRHIYDCTNTNIKGK